MGWVAWPPGVLERRPERNDIARAESERPHHAPTRDCAHASAPRPRHESGPRHARTHACSGAALRSKSARIRAHLGG